VPATLGDCDWKFLSKSGSADGAQPRNYSADDRQYGPFIMVQFLGLGGSGIKNDYPFSGTLRQAIRVLNCIWLRVIQAT
jgi:hypothetical protein